MAGIRRGWSVTFDSQVGLALVCTLSDGCDRIVDAHLVVPSGPLPDIITAEVDGQPRLCYTMVGGDQIRAGCHLPPRAYQVSYNEHISALGDQRYSLGPCYNVGMRNSAGAVASLFLPPMRDQFPHVSVLPLVECDDSGDDTPVTTVANVRYTSNVVTHAYADDYSSLPGTIWCGKRVKNIHITGWGLGLKGENINQRILCCAAPLFAAAMNYEIRFASRPVLSLADLSTRCSRPWCENCSLIDEIMDAGDAFDNIPITRYSRVIRLYGRDSLRTLALHAARLVDEGMECKCPCEPLPVIPEYESEEDDPYCSDSCECEYKLFNPEEGLKRTRTCTAHYEY